VRRVSKARVEAVTDGIFAIAITLLVLTIAQPDDDRRLTHQLVQRWPSLAAYVVSFAVIGIMWFNHHSIFGHIARVDRPLFYLNLFLLMTVAFLPYPTGVLGQALGRGEGTRAAAVFYSATMVVNAFAWSALWLYASTDRRLLERAFPEARRVAATIAFTSGTVAYVVALAVALINAYACLAFHGALALYYALDPLSRRAAGSGSEAPDELL
jgi:uncharacterized membrane protein